MPQGEILKYKIPETSHRRDKTTSHALDYFPHQLRTLPGPPNPSDFGADEYSPPTGETSLGRYRRAERDLGAVFIATRILERSQSCRQHRLSLQPATQY